MYHIWYSDGKYGGKLSTLGGRHLIAGCSLVPTHVDRGDLELKLGAGSNRWQQQFVLSAPPRKAKAWRSGHRNKLCGRWNRLRICADLPRSGNGRRSLAVRENLSPIPGTLASILRGLVGGASSTQICHAGSVTYDERCCR